ncbi:uncharacterized protein L201_004874 [Kwoniella dendrophila CBS 6074]|uniref:F-box domain-containing protein n=1 Tax=Kwoniella dendrophila CBS 6074 TaxID=1295534 RepID=A0AAX4JZD2_9TREE
MFGNSSSTIPLDLLPQIIDYLPLDSHDEYTLLSLQRTSSAFFPIATNILYRDLELKTLSAFKSLFELVKCAIQPRSEVLSENACQMQSNKVERNNLYRKSVNTITFDNLPPTLLLKEFFSIFRNPVEQENRSITCQLDSDSFIFPNCHHINFTQKACIELQSRIWEMSDFQNLGDILSQFLFILAKPESLSIYKPSTNNLENSPSFCRNWYHLFTTLCEKWSNTLRRIYIMGDHMKRLKPLVNGIEHYFHFIVNFTSDGNEEKCDRDTTKNTLSSHFAIPGYLGQPGEDDMASPPEHTIVDDDGGHNIFTITEYLYWKNIREFAEIVYQLVKPHYTLSDTVFASADDDRTLLPGTAWYIHLPRFIGANQIDWTQIDDIEKMVLQLLIIRIPEDYEEFCEITYTGDHRKDKLRRIEWIIDD